MNRGAWIAIILVLLLIAGIVVYSRFVTNKTSEGTSNPSVLSTATGSATVSPVQPVKVVTSADGAFQITVPASWVIFDQTPNSRQGQFGAIIQKLTTTSFSPPTGSIPENGILLDVEISTNPTTQPITQLLNCENSCSVQNINGATFLKFDSVDPAVTVYFGATRSQVSTIRVRRGPVKDKQAASDQINQVINSILLNP